MVSANERGEWAALGGVERENGMIEYKFLVETKICILKYKIRRFYIAEWKWIAGLNLCSLTNRKGIRVINLSFSMNPLMKEVIICCWFQLPLWASWFVKGSPSGFIQQFFSGFSSETFCSFLPWHRRIQSNWEYKLWRQIALWNKFYTKLDKQES